jgi:hypothetical protein
VRTQHSLAQGQRVTRVHLPNGDFHSGTVRLRRVVRLPHASEDLPADPDEAEPVGDPR